MTGLRTTPGVGIAAVACHPGELRVPIADLANAGRLPAAQLDALAAAGFDSYLCADPPCVERLTQAALARLPGPPAASRAMELLVFCSTVFETTALFPDLVCQRIAAASGYGAVKAFAIQHAYCVSPFVALMVMRAYLSRTDRPACGIVVCADAAGRQFPWLRPIASVGIHSDGAAAILVTNREPRYRFIDFEVFIDPARFRGQQADGSIEADPRHFMLLAKMIRTLLHRNAIRTPDRVAIYPNNLDRRAWARICTAVGLDPTALRVGENVGHVFGADPFLNLAARPPAPGEYCILAASGIAGSFGAALLAA